MLGMLCALPSLGYVSSKQVYKKHLRDGRLEIAEGGGGGGGGGNKVLVQLTPLLLLCSLGGW